MSKNKVLESQKNSLKNAVTQFETLNHQTVFKPGQKSKQVQTCAVLFWTSLSSFILKVGAIHCPSTNRSLGQILLKRLEHMLSKRQFSQQQSLFRVWQVSRPAEIYFGDAGKSKSQPKNLLAIRPPQPRKCSTASTESAPLPLQRVLGYHMIELSSLAFHSFLSAPEQKILVDCGLLQKCLN